MSGRAPTPRDTLVSRRRFTPFRRKLFRAWVMPTANAALSSGPSRSASMAMAREHAAMADSESTASCQTIPL